MNKITKNLSYLILFSAFILFTRYLQLIKDHNFPHNISIIGSKIFKDSKCLPKEESILSKIKKNNIKTLLIVLDGYPTRTNYKRYTGKESKLHNYLERISNQAINGKTIVNSTSYSLAYLLGDLTPSNGCTYPTFQGNYPSHFLVANTYYSSKNSICKDNIKEKISYMPPLARVIKSGFQVLSNKINVPNKNPDLYSCSLDNSSSVNKILKNIKNNKKLKDKNLLIVHEVKWHDMVKLKDLDKFDLNYKESIEKLYYSLYDSNIVDEILILSDHGTANMPLGENGQQFKDLHFGSTPAKSLNFIEEDLFSVFMYRIEMNDKRKTISKQNKDYIFGNKINNDIYLINAQARLKKVSN